ncbi:MAG: DUF2231 domain-containing protein [Promethearchaeota archaeon]
MAEKELRRFTTTELEQFDGNEGRPSYIAYKGKVYDVSNSRLWKNGKHAGRHFAGDDLTPGMINAPHDDIIFVKFPIVGELSTEVPAMQNLKQKLEGLHIHPIVVHFSIAYSIIISLLTLLYVFTGVTSFEAASYYMLILGFLTGPPCALSGVFSWKVTYEGRRTKTFVRKIVYTILLIAIITAGFAWRTLNPNILLSLTNLSYIYLAVIWSLVPIATILGHYGGKIVYS